LDEDPPAEEPDRDIEELPPFDPPAGAPPFLDAPEDALLFLDPPEGALLCETAPLLPPLNPLEPPPDGVLRDPAALPILRDPAAPPPAL
jgi:hypothetical protein